MTVSLSDRLPLSVGGPVHATGHRGSLESGEATAVRFLDPSGRRIRSRVTITPLASLLPRSREQSRVQSPVEDERAKAAEVNCRVPPVVSC